jgi:amidohydrolase
MDKDLHDKLTEWRRHLHANPELTLHEAETSKFVQARLAEMGIPFVANVGGHGVVATLTRGQSNRAVGLRADMDALPILETSGLAHASTKPGVMHACGHDGHTTSLLGAAMLLKDDPSWTGTIHLVFQPAEEGGGGAKSMIADGLFTRFPMERIFGYHNWPGLEAGTVMVHDGPSMAAGARVFITVKGHAGHAAMPHLTRDPMVAAAHLVIALQSIVARNVDPQDSAVLTIGTIRGGSAANQIPESIEMRGTMRTFKPAVRDLIEARIRDVCDGVARMFGMEIDLEIRRGVEVTVNTPGEAGLAVDVAREQGIAVRRDLAPTMGGEDFSWFLRERPGCYAWIGNGPAEPGKELHNPAYDFNDAILPVAATWLASVARKSLTG